MASVSDYTDDVRGVIIGGDDTEREYTFYVKNPGFPFVSWLSRGAFASDVEAEAWIKEHYPAAYAIGIEMRVRL